MPRTSGDAAIEGALRDPAIRFYIDREIRYGQTRVVEVFLALVMFGSGTVLLWPGSTFVAPDGDVVRAYRVIALFVREETAGWIGSAVGGVRLWAIYRNGAVRFSPIPRTLGCLAGAAFWSALSIGFIAAVPPLSLATVIFPLAAAFEIYSARRAAADLIVLDSFGLRERERRRERDRGPSAA